MTIETRPEARTIISGQPYHLNCIITLIEPGAAELDAAMVQWFNSTGNGSLSQIFPDYHVSIGNLTAISRQQYDFPLHFLSAETFYSGEYICQSEYEGIIRQMSVSISIERKSIY